MEQLTLGLSEKSKVKIIAASPFNFRIELIERVGREDIAQLVEVSHELAKKFGEYGKLSKANITKYFNHNTLPFVARYNDKIIGYIIGVPLEYFKNESWSHFDVNIGKDNTLYTYAFAVKEQYQKKGGYAKTLKRIFVNWARKKNYTYLTGHVEQGKAINFSKDTEIVKVFQKWYDSKTPFEYYRRPLKPLISIRRTPT